MRERERPDGILSLDIDGVAITRTSITARHESTKTTSVRKRLSGLVDIECVRRLVQFCNDTGCDVLLSSSWRKDPLWYEVNTFLKSRGLRGKVIGRTPFGDRHDPRFFKAVVGRMPADGEPWPRGIEIYQFLIEHYGEDYPPTVIVDDDDDMQPLKHLHVHTTWEHGFTERSSELAHEVFQRETLRSIGM